MRVLVACEESQTVTKAFREKGHEAFSCDILDCSGGRPEWHIKGDCREYIFDNLDKLDLIIAHPPCTRLSNSGVRWLNERGLWSDMRAAADFFRGFCTLHDLSNGKIKVAIENPIQHKYCQLPKYTQIIQPWQFGHGETKATCLWLYGLPKLVPTDIVNGRDQRVWKMGPGPERSKLRSKTYAGIAKAMADQWG